MIVLDEQLIGDALPELLERWYRGAVVNIVALRPHTSIRDEEIPKLLRSVRQPTFVTINVSDFWRKLAPDRQFGLIAFQLLDRDAQEIPELLRRVFRLAPFRTRRSRLGKVARVSREQVQYYTADSWAMETIRWPRRRP
jgi:hypothetical protein